MTRQTPLWLMRFVPGVVLLAMTFTCLGLQSTPALAADPGQPPAAIVVYGKGNGHGRGMSQYGALGWATTFAKTWQEILAFYYGGTTLSSLGPADAPLTPGGVMSVRLTTLDGRQTAVLSDNSSLLLSNDPVPGRKWTSLVAREISGTVGTYRVWGSTTPACPSAASDPTASNFVQVADIAGGVTFTTALSNDPSVAVVPNDAVGLCEPTGRVRYYRGAIRALNGSDGENRTVNLVQLDAYLRGVVPRESPASWGDIANGAGMNALRAQAVAARSYSLGQARYSYAKTCDTQSCQVYGGAALREKVGGVPLVLEDIRTNAAIADTSGVVVRNANGGVVSTEFTSSNGGRTAGTTFPMQIDAGDVAADSSDLSWSTVIAAKTFETKYPEIGVLLSVVTTHDGMGGEWNGYATSVAINGTAGTKILSGWDFRSIFSLRAPWYETISVFGSGAADPVVGPILFLGDSVGESVRAEFDNIVRPAYPTVNYQAVTGRCMIGATCMGLPDGITVINSLTPEQVPAIAIIELGYNDSPGSYASEVEQVTAALIARGVQRIIFVNMSTRRTTTDFGSMNVVLANAAATNPRITLFDWNTHSIQASQWRWYVKNDNVHLTSTGQTEFALFLRAQLDALRVQGLLPQSAAAPDLIVGLPLRVSNKGDMVKVLQRSLNTAFKLKKKALLIDGVYGKTTKALVARYETVMGIPVDGLADEAVWKALGLDKKRSNSVLRRGTQHPSVKTAQAALSRVLKVSLTATGTYDNRTFAYVKQFQARVKLRPTGNMNRLTWLALMTTAART